MLRCEPTNINEQNPLNADARMDYFVSLKVDAVQLDGGAQLNGAEQASFLLQMRVM
jgi:hypothetical protein